jgi:hypothetical protein
MLDISRKGGDPFGIHFAPSWFILRPMLEMRKKFGRVTEQAWNFYKLDYYTEMYVSLCAWPSAWQTLLQRDLVTLCCYCSDATHCHRLLLVDFLRELGPVEYLGERTKPVDAQLNLL